MKTKNYEMYKGYKLVESGQGILVYKDGYFVGGHFHTVDLAKDSINYHLDNEFCKQLSKVLKD